MSFHRKPSWQFSQWMMTNTEPCTHLYIHVPFCAHICSYCDFVHIMYHKETVEQWLSAIRKEMEHACIPDTLETIYIGGGTPTALEAEQLDDLLSLIDPYAKHVQEYTIEINPETLDATKAAVLRKHGIDRASIGFQSSDHNLLSLMGRNHTMETMHTCMHLLRRVGITNISLDLMYSLPGQSMAQLQQSLFDALSLKPTHMSLYSLTIEDNTVFKKKGYEHLDEDSEADMYEWIVETLHAKDYHQYEVSNFALDGYWSRHNIGYWQYDDFIGIGAGASGKENGNRYDHVRSVQAYIKDPCNRQLIQLSIEDQMFESLMMGIRMKEGMDLAVFEKRFGETFEQHYETVLAGMLEQGYMEIVDGRLRASEKGYEIMNSLLVEFL